MTDVDDSRITLNNQLWPAFCPVFTHAVYEWTVQAPTRRSRPTDRGGFLLADSFFIIEKAWSLANSVTPMDRVDTSGQRGIFTRGYGLTD